MERQARHRHVALPQPVVIHTMASKPPEIDVPLVNATFVLTHHMVAQARRHIDSGASKGKIVEWRDGLQEGLVLRIRPRSGVWFLRRRTQTLRIGDISDTDVWTARRWAKGALHCIRLKADPRIYLEKVRSARERMPDTDAYVYEEEILSIDGDGNFYDGKSISRSGEEDDPSIWTWDDLLEQYLNYKLPLLTTRWACQYEELLRHSAFSSIRKKSISQISFQDLSDIKAALSKIPSKSQASRAVKQAKKMLDWGFDEHRGRIGMVQVSVPCWSRWNLQHASGYRFNAPPVEHLARTLVLAEFLHHNPPAGRRGISAGMLGALWAVVLTAQRIGQLLPTTIDRIYSSDHVPPGWRVVNWTAAEMKPARGVSLPHSLPVPPAFVEIVEKYRSDGESADCVWMFPSPTGSGPISNTGLEALLRKMQGIRYQSKRPLRTGSGQGRGRKGLVRTGSSRKIGESLMSMYGIDGWTPHDVRRSLASFLDDHSLGGAASAILAHREDRTRDLRENARNRAAPVTRIHYSRAQRLEMKAAGMEAWTQAVLSAYADERKRFRPPENLDDASA